MKNIAGYQQSIHNQRVSKRVNTLDGASDAQVRVAAGPALDSVLEDELAEYGELLEVAPQIDPTMRKFVKRSTVADFATDGSVVINQPHIAHNQSHQHATRHNAPQSNGTSHRFGTEHATHNRPATKRATVRQTVVATANVAPTAPSTTTTQRKSTVQRMSVTQISPEVVNATDPVSTATMRDKPLLVTRRESTGETIGLFGKIVRRIVNWYQPIEMPFVCAVFALLILFSYVLHPHSAFISNTIQPAFFALPSSPISSLEYSILPVVDQTSANQPVNDIYTPYLPVTDQEYTVKAGQTLSQLAEFHGVSMSTLVSYNDISNARSLQAGQVYRVPDREGLLIEPSATDTVYAISQQYSVAPEAILDANDLEILELSSADQLFVPGASLSDFDLRLVIGDLFVFPVRGRLTSGYGYRNDPFTGVRRFHYGLDIASYTGAPIAAAMEGRVSYVGEQRGGYGKYVIVKHPGGFQTLYAHLSTISVSNGQYVSRGQQVGRMGNTGRSTGPHLHFSIIKNGTFVNPALYLY